MAACLVNMLFRRHACKLLVSSSFPPPPGALSAPCSVIWQPLLAGLLRIQSLTDSSTDGSSHSHRKWEAVCRH